MLDLSLIYNAYGTSERIRVFQDFQELLARIIINQQIDSTYYEFVNFDDPISTLSYFKKLCRPLLSLSEEEFDQMFTHFKENGSKISAEAQAHHIMRSAAEKIDVALIAFRKMKREEMHVFLVDEIMVDAVQEAFGKILVLIRDCNNELEKDRDHTKRS